LRTSSRGALDEDLGGDPGRDVTLQATIGVDQEATGHVVARADGVVAGLAVWSVVLGHVADRFPCPCRLSPSARPTGRPWHAETS